MTATHAAPAVGVRLCEDCERPLPALRKNEYTPARARLVAERGLCLCPAAGNPDRLPDRAPSLLQTD